MTRQKDQRMVQSKFICQECGALMVLYRKRAEQRKLGHVKHMHCPSCKETRAFTEIKDWDRNVVFWEDYQEALLTEEETAELWDALWVRSSESLLHGLMGDVLKGRRTIMDEDNIFEGHEFEAKADFEMDWEDLLDELRDYEIPEERLSELAAQDSGFPFLELNFQELRYLNLMDEQLYVRENESAEFYKSMANTYGTRLIDGTEYALMDDFAYHYFHEMMTVEAVDRQGRQFVMVYGMPDNWEEIERQVEEKVWDPSEEDEVAAAEGTEMWEHPDMVISMIDFRNEIINRAALEFRKNGVPLELYFLSKRMFINDVLASRAITLRMPGIIAAFENISANFSDVDHFAFSMDEKRIRIFYADTDETIDHTLSACGRIAHGSAKRSGIGEVCYDTFLDRVERALFELIFLVNKPTDELAFVSGVAMQRLDAVRAGELDLSELTLDEVNRLMLSFPELLNLDWLFS